MIEVHHDSHPIARGAGVIRGYTTQFTIRIIPTHPWFKGHIIAVPIEIPIPAGTDRDVKVTRVGFSG